MSLSKRITKLENGIQDNIPPEPTPVYFEGDPRIDTAGGKCVIIVTVDSRKAQEVDHEGA